jgi:hypothetical protein
VTFEITEFDFTTAAPGYLIVNDVIRTQGGAIGRVATSVVSTVLTDKQKVTVDKVDGTNHLTVACICLLKSGTH